MKKTKKMLNEKMQVKLPESLSTENIMANMENSKAEIVEMPKKKNTAKKLVPMVASLLLVVGIVGMYMSLQQKDVPATNSGDKTDVMAYQSYDKIYEKFDKLHKEAKKYNLYNGIENFFYADGVVEENAIADFGATGTDSLAGDTAVTVPMAENVNGSVEATDNREHGTTNTQEKDVDEGDIIKTDGNYLYIANADSKEVSIVDVSDKKMKEASEIELEDNEVVEEIYINDDRLVVVGHLQKEEEIKTGNNRYMVEDCIAYMPNDTFVKVYDISDRAKPKLENEFSQQGSYNNSRMIGTKLYTISEYYVNVYGDDYRDNCIPEVEVNDVCKTVPADSIYMIEESPSTTYAVITTLDLSKDSDPESSAILGECNHLYASSKGLFLSETTFDETDNYTKIYKFDYTDTGVKHMCTGRVPGYINNQFSMSYDGEYFRIATTDNNVETDGKSVSFSIENRTNNLYILNNQMQIVGKVEDLAKGEQIESVRFVGNMAYVVTFRQTDPLFVIDLNDPKNPTVKGELKIPGFSEYLHPITENLLVGVGQDGTDTGTNGDCKVSLFDVSNPYEPKETSLLKVSNGKAYCHTPVAYNHKLYINLSENEFAVPFSIDPFVAGDYQKSHGNYYIRYKLTGDGLCEVARYQVGDMDSQIMGATFVEDVLYVVAENYKIGTYVVAFDLITNEQIDKLQTGEWK